MPRGREKVNFTCSVENCEKLAHAKGWCRQHWTRMHLYRRLHKIQGIEKGNCKVEGCDNPIKGKALCHNHYQMNRKYGRTAKLTGRNKTKHPFYTMWFERKQDKNLCNEWLDFWKFVSDIGERPAANFVLFKLTGDAPYGPDNFQWKELTVRRMDETDKEIIARQWEAQRVRNPDQEYDRNLQRRFGITLVDYNKMLWLQNGACAICREKETAFSKSDRAKRLSVDHCHKTNNIRELLCNRCNGTLGRVNDSVEHLQSMINYLLKHKEV